MKIEGLSIHKINLGSSNITLVDHADAGTDFNNYIKSLIASVTSNDNSRKFGFRSDTTEMCILINRCISNNETFEVSTKTAADRLLREEIAVQKRMSHLTEIQKGILLQAHIIENDVRKFIICKADDTLFINENDFKVARGFPIERKIFKSFLAVFNGNNEIDDILVFDTNRKIAAYWWDKYLELNEKWDDSYNTKRAFEAIDSKVLAPIRKKHPADHMHLRNSTIRYFRATEQFTIDDYLENGIGNYLPIDSEMNITELKSKIRQLPAKHDFDRNFGVVREEVTAKMKSKVRLTDNIDLIIKQDIDIDNTIQAELGDNDTKYIKIRTDRGYDIFKSRQNTEGN